MLLFCFALFCFVSRVSDLKELDDKDRAEIRDLQVRVILSLDSCSSNVSKHFVNLIFIQTADELASQQLTRIQQLMEESAKQEQQSQVRVHYSLFLIDCFYLS